MTQERFVKDDLISLRKALGLTQQEMAGQLDMALRSYQSIEAGESEYRYIHRLAADRVALQLAADKKDPSLAPPSVRADAVALVQVGQRKADPEFTWDSGQASRAAASSADTEFRAAYAIVGEIVLLATALDHQLNHVLIHILALTTSPMLETVVATLDTARKIEMLKERSKHINQPQWRKGVATYLEKLERVAKWRNIVCHTPLIPDSKHGAVFAPAAAAKLLKSLRLGDEPHAKRVPIADVKAAKAIGEAALGEGQNLIENFQRLNAEHAKRFGRR